MLEVGRELFRKCETLIYFLVDASYFPKAILLNCVEIIKDYRTSSKMTNRWGNVNI
jgi:hypothetical protein